MEKILINQRKLHTKKDKTSKNDVIIEYILQE